MRSPDVQFLQVLRLQAVEPVLADARDLVDVNSHPVARDRVLPHERCSQAGGPTRKPGKSGLHAEPLVRQG